jgi:hypothetical protein
MSYLIFFFKERKFKREMREDDRRLRELLEQHRRNIVKQKESLNKIKGQKISPLLSMRYLKQQLLLLFCY